MRTRAAAFALLSALPAAAGPLEDLKPGEWYEVPDSRLDAVKPDPVPPGYVAAVMDAWSGAAFDGKRRRLVVWGGGHGDYSGNELYAFDMKTLKWSRVSEPSRDVGGDEKTGTYPDGLPRSRHTYNSIQYLPAIDRFCAFGAAGMYPGGQVGTARTECFDFGVGKWEAKAATPTYGIANFSAVDPATGAVWAGKGTLTRFDPAADTWGKKTEYDNGIEWTNYLTLEADPVRRALFAVGAGKVIRYDISDPARPILAAAQVTSGDRDIEAAQGPGLAYDSLGGRMIAWAGGADVYAFEPDARAWTKQAGTGAVPTKANANGTYGRFRHAGGDLYVAVNRTSENVFIHRLAPAKGSALAPRAPIRRGHGDPASRDAAGRLGTGQAAGLRFPIP